MKNIGIIILAAGSSRRMGRPKQLLPINGQPLLLRVVEEALSSPVSHVMVVLGSNHQSHCELLETYPVHIAQNHDWENGIGTSIRRGVEELTGRVKDLDAVLIMVGDQPAIRFEYLNHIINTYQRSSFLAIASGYAGTYGVPALFDKSLFAELMNLRDEEGAKAILSSRRSEILILDCPEGELDLDTPEDVVRFQEEYLHRAARSIS